jgi:DnaJ family protein A protein 2
MAAFEKGGNGGMPDDFDVNDMFEHLFSGGGGPSFSGFGGGGGGPPPGFFFDPNEMGGMGGGGGAGKRRKRQKGRDEEKEHEVTLEELYKGKTIKFASTKSVVCSHCKGSGGKEKAKTTTCSTCRGAGECTQSQHEGNQTDEK